MALTKKCSKCNQIHSIGVDCSIAVVKPKEDSWDDYVKVMASSPKIDKNNERTK